MMVDTVATESIKMGITINTAKTELMKIRTQDARCVSIGGSNLNKVDNYIFFRLPNK